MKSYRLKGATTVLLVLSILHPLLTKSQTVYNANFQTINFGGSGVTISYKVGTNGKSAGNVTLYSNVITINGQSFDAIIRTTSLSAGTVMDYFDAAGSGSGYSNNQATWFSPQFTFPSGGGQVMFDFEFILGGSYNNLTKKGTDVILENVRVNTYDIDGNGNNNSNQFNEFGGFSTSELSTNTNVTATYNYSTGLTKFRSTTSSNITDATSSSSRVRVTYAQMGKFSIQIGAGSSGQAFFFLDFGMGSNWPVSTTTVTAPTLDLNTTTPGNNNTGTFCSTSIPFTAGNTNISSVSSTPSSGTTLEQLSIGFTTSEILNTDSEQLLINGATSGATIDLSFLNGAVIPNVVLSGVTYTVTATVAEGKSLLVFEKNNSSTMTLAQAETLLDAFRYYNSATVKLSGARIFEIKIKDGAYESQAYTFTATVSTIPLITVEPQNITITSGSNTVITVLSTASSFQWQVNPKTGVFTDIVNNSMYSGATTSSLVITAAPGSIDNYQYRVIVSSGGCPVTSNTSILSISALLPVTWGSFIAKKQNQHVLLNWNTTNELNSKEYVIQHSSDGRVFNNIGLRTASGNSSGESMYNYIHTQPGTGQNFYRIIQIDKDGRNSMSKVINFIFSNETSDIDILSGTVVNGRLSIQVNKTTDVFLYNSAGTLLIKKRLNPGPFLIDLRSYPKGIYVLLTKNKSIKITLTN